MAAADVLGWAVVFARFLVPLAIPRWPLPGVLASIVLDAADQSILDAVLGGPFSRYQPYDKALDVYSLSVTMLAILRNWQSLPAVRIARFLFYFRLVGVLAFELTGWRPLLAVFANTFELFFVFYEIVRAWWSPVRLVTRSLVRAAAVIWVLVRLPHELWLHVARLDLTDVIEAWLPGAPLRGRTVALLVASAAAVIAVALGAAVVRAVAPPPQHRARLAADPLPVSIDEAHERAGHVAERWRVLDRHLAEKIVLVARLTVIFASIVPGVAARPAQLVAGVVVLATLNSFLRVRSARRGRWTDPAVLSFLLVAATNASFVLAAHLLLRGANGVLPLPAALFFLLLLSLVVTLYDRWHPVFDERFRPAAARSP